MIPWIESISAVFLWIRNLFNKGCSVTTSVRLRLTSQTNQVAVDSELNLVMDSALTVEVSCFRGVRLGYKTWRLEVSYQFLPEPVINFKSLVKIRDKILVTFLSFPCVVLAINRPGVRNRNCCGHYSCQPLLLFKAHWVGVPWVYIIHIMPFLSSDLNGWQPAILNSSMFPHLNYKVFFNFYVLCMYHTFFECFDMSNWINISSHADHRSY